MKRKRETFWLSILIFFDVLLAVSGPFLGGLIFNKPIILSGAANKYTLVFLLYILFFFHMYDLYQLKSYDVYGAMISAAFSIVFASISTFITAFLLRWSLLTADLWFVAAFTSFILLIGWRTFAAYCIKKYGDKRKCLIIEDMTNTSRLARKIKYASNLGRETFYFMIDESNDAEVQKLINNVMKDYDLIFISPAIKEEVVQKILTAAYLLGKDISVLADLNNISTFNGKIYQIDDTPVIEKRSAYMSRYERAFKRAFDIAFAVILGILSLPVFLICAILIKLDSEGPVFYKQERYTIHKNIFSVYKFRTMIKDAEKGGAQLATDDDPRITKIGKFLRATRLDELPQIINILSGSMSVVGPRPERPVFADEFSEKVQNYDLRFLVKAGLTGYAQIYGKYNTRVSDKILMDIIYIVNYSLLNDLKIILLTGKTMFLKSATEGVDEEKDRELSSIENEQERREETIKKLGVCDESVDNHTGV